MTSTGHPEHHRLARRVFFRLAMGLVVCFSLALSAGFGLAKEKSSASKSKSSKQAVSSTDLTKEKFQSAIKKYLGIPYQLGGSNRNGTDCSGLIRQMYGNLFGLELPHNAAAQSRLPHLEEVSKDELKVGDLLFFGPSKGRINHMGAYLGDGEFIHASRKHGATTVSSLDKPYWRKRFVSSKHIKGLDLSDADWSEGLGASTDFDDEHENAAGSEAIEWTLFALDGNFGAGFVNELTLAPFFDLTLETFTLWSGWESLDTALFDPNIELEYYDGSSDLYFRQGVRLSKELALAPWLQVAPFWSYARQQDDGITQPKSEHNLGLSAEIGHPALPWSISLAAQPFIDKQQTIHPSLWERDWRQLELFFGCRYNISDAWRFSLFGSGNTGSLQEDLSEIPTKKAEPAVEDVTVMIDFTF